MKPKMMQAAKVQTVLKGGVPFRFTIFFLPPLLGGWLVTMILYLGRPERLSSRRQLLPPGGDAAQKPVTKRSGRSLRKKGCSCSLERHDEDSICPTEVARPRGRLSEEIKCSQQARSRTASDGE
jgi:hypothetical protein